MKTISIVVPAFNEKDNISPLCERLVETLESISDCGFEIIIIDDGSSDGTLEAIREARKGDDRIRFLSFSRNFGHEAASTAGFDSAGGDCVVLIDADLQDPPEVIPEMVRKWREGFEVVYARRRKREGEGFFKRGTSFLFYRLINLLTPQKFPLDTGDFRLIDRKVLRALRRMKDYNRMIRGMISWLGFRQTAVYYDRSERLRGKTKYNFLKLLWLSFDAVTSFSIIPLRISTALGFMVMIISFVFGLIVLYQKLFLNLAIQGYALQTVALLFLGGVQLLMLGIIGEYIGKTYVQTLDRPLYVISERCGVDDEM